MILDIYKDALEYSAKDWKTLVILGVICLFSFLLLPLLPDITTELSTQQFMEL